MCCQLKVAAKVDPVDQHYWADEIAPLFAANNVEFLGEVTEEAKAALLGRAYATLFPLDWPEPFGLVMKPCPARIDAFRSWA